MADPHCVSVILGSLRVRIPAEVEEGKRYHARTLEAWALAKGPNSDYAEDVLEWQKTEVLGFLRPVRSLH